MYGKVLREARLLAAALAVGLVAAGLVALWGVVDARAGQRAAAEGVLRFHLQAHAATVEDVAVKYRVRDAILREFSHVFAGGGCVEGAREMAKDALPRMAALAEEISGRTATATVGEARFPVTFYGAAALPRGVYEAVIISLGDGAGGNWWCLLFPPLCYLDMTVSSYVPGAITGGEVRVRLRIVEWWRGRR
jgi:stage II sporulation protein R